MEALPCGIGWRGVIALILLVGISLSGTGAGSHGGAGVNGRRVDQADWRGASSTSTHSEKIAVFP
jgi:hypothetical protein